MRQKIIVLLLILIPVLTLTACSFGGKEEKETSKTNEEEKETAKTKEKALAFKEDYEKINNVETPSGVHRSVTLSEDNRFMETTVLDIIKRIENKETFYVYFGSNLCPWCRSVIETADKVSRNNDIERIYYVDIWDEQGNEILRDKYTLENGKATVVNEGAPEYKKLLEYLGSQLDDYTLTDSNNKTIMVGEKRIYAPTYFYIEKGKAVKSTTGISPKQTNSRAELTEEILKYQEEEFSKLFKNSCDVDRKC